MKTTLTFLALLILSTGAMARTFSAPVVSVREVNDRYAVPEEICRNERVDDDWRDDRRSGNNATGTIVGALVGGALGNQVGKGDGRTAATIGGAVIGGVVGNNIDRNNGSRNRGRSEYVCYTQNRWETRRAFDVTYRFRNRLITERFDRRPGRYVTINR